MALGSLALVSSCVVRLLLGDASFYDASVETVARGRTRAATTGVLGELEATPRLRLSWLDRRLELGLAYAPRLLLQGQGTGLQTLHSAGGDARLLLDGGWRALVSAAGSYGTTDFLLAAPSSPGTPPAPLQTLPRVTILRTMSADVSVGVEGPAAPRLHGSAQLTAFTSGAVASGDRVSLPLQRGARLSSELAWTATGFDVLATSLTATVTKVDPDVLDGFAVAMETWRHTLSPETEFRVGLGPAVLAHREGGQTSWSVLPSGEVGARDRLWRVVDADLSLRAAPVVDRVTGALYERADATALLGWRPFVRWTFSLSASAGVVLQGAQERDTLAAGEARAAWSPVPAWGFAVGARALSQMAHVGGPDTREVAAFVAVAASTRDRLF